MALYLEIAEGPNAGQRYRLNPGTRVGRTKGEILINDPKISGLHCQVEKDRNGQLILADRGSANGLKVGGIKVSKVVLLPGVKFRMGNTLAKVVQLFGDDQPEEDQEPQSWRDILVSQVPKIQMHNQPAPPAIMQFDPVLRLDFIEGAQASQKFLLGYGPRKAGSEVLDIEVHDPESPALAFEIIPVEGGARFVTQHPKSVLLNGRSVSSDILTEDDRIQIGRTVIAIKYQKK